MYFHTPGVLSLCIGIPVMIKKNIATKLCIINGAEAFVVGWKVSNVDRYGNVYPALDTLYVLLKEPPFKIENLGYLLMLSKYQKTLNFITRLSLH